MQLYPTFKIYTQPTAEPVSIDELDVHGRIDGVDEMVFANGLISAARRKVEEDTGLQLMTAVYRGYLDAFPRIYDQNLDYRAYDATYAYRPIRLPIGPIQTFDSLQYVDTAGVTQTWASSNYRTDLVRTPARITPEFGIAWPVNRMVTNSIILGFTAGYASVALVPQLAKLTICMLASEWFKNREADYAGKEPAPDMMGAYRSLIHTLHWMEFDE